MPAHLIALGLFVFGIDSLAYDELQRRASFRHAKTERHGVRAASQFLGPGEEAITLTGRLIPEIAGRRQAIEDLRAMAMTGETHELVLGTGEVLGQFRILAVDDRWQTLLPGGLPRAIDFAIELERADG